MSGLEFICPTLGQEEYIMGGLVTAVPPVYLLLVAVTMMAGVRGASGGLLVRRTFFILNPP